MLEFPLEVGVPLLGLLPDMGFGFGYKQIKETAWNRVFQRIVVI